MNRDVFVSRSNSPPTLPDSSENVRAFCDGSTFQYDAYAQPKARRIVSSVDWTIFDGGQRAALVEQQDAALERSRASYDATLLTALSLIVLSVLLSVCRARSIAL